MKVLCVAEKPSIARSISTILSGGQFATVSLMQVLIDYLTNWPLRSVRQPTNTLKTSTSTIHKLIPSIPSPPSRVTSQRMTSGKRIEHGTHVIPLCYLTHQSKPKSHPNRKALRRIWRMKQGEQICWWFGQIVIARGNILGLRLQVYVEGPNGISS